MHSMATQANPGMTQEVFVGGVYDSELNFVLRHGMPTMMHLLVSSQLLVASAPGGVGLHLRATPLCGSPFESVLLSVNRGTLLPLLVTLGGGPPFSPSSAGVHSWAFESVLLSVKRGTPLSPPGVPVGAPFSVEQSAGGAAVAA